MIFTNIETDDYIREKSICFFGCLDVIVKILSVSIKAIL